ncbi:hypothetical protein ABGB18_16275 [Nonomuraea sp. B12E4]|uniref:hypothetical protein n=1 Tax=Nonomuraea sp. B12E4 TaxID=3153564 RepID=UPI00325D4407
MTYLTCPRLTDLACPGLTDLACPGLTDLVARKGFCGFFAGEIRCAADERRNGLTSF